MNGLGYTKSVTITATTIAFFLSSRWMKDENLFDPRKLCDATKAKVFVVGRHRAQGSLSTAEEKKKEIKGYISLFRKNTND